MSFTSCDCKKHRRRFLNGPLNPGYRSWPAAEDKKRELEDQLSECVPVIPTTLVRAWPE
jgi:hypothetical protein